MLMFHYSLKTTEFSLIFQRALFGVRPIISRADSRRKVYILVEIVGQPLPFNSDRIIFIKEVETRKQKVKLLDKFVGFYLQHFVISSGMQSCHFYGII